MMTPVYLTSDLRAGGAGAAQGLRLRARRQPDAQRARGLPRLARGGEARHRRSRRASPPRTTVLSLWRRATAWSPGTTSTAAPTASSSTVFRRLGLDLRRTSTRATSASVERALKKKADLLWLETPTNPLLKITDLARRLHRSPRRAASPVRRRQHLRLALPPATARARRRPRDPLDDEVPGRPLRPHRRAQSSRSDAARRERLPVPARTRRGRCPAPLDCFLVLRGMKTLARPHGPPLRQRRAARAAGSARHPRVKRVWYPGLPSAPEPRDREAADVAASAGWSRSSSTATSRTRKRFCAATQRLQPRREPRRRRVADRAPRVDDPRVDPRRGAAEGRASPTALLRLSVGLEHVDDLRADLEQAFARTFGT